MFDWLGLGDCHRCGKSQVGAWFRGDCKCEPLPPPITCVHPRHRNNLDKILNQSQK